jgi:DNA-binding NarL/FixJ family response regulator
MPNTDPDFEVRVQETMVHIRSLLQGRPAGSCGIGVNGADPVWREATARLIAEDVANMVSEAGLSPEDADRARTLTERLRAIATRAGRGYTNPDTPDTN